MKNKIILLIAFVLAVMIADAQDVSVPSSVQPGQASQKGLGALIGQLTDNLSDKAFTSDFLAKKGDFTSSVTNTSDAPGLSNSLQTLEKGLDPSAMDKGWSAIRSRWITDAQSASRIETVAALAQKLESNIDPSYFKGDWAEVKQVWESALGAVAR